MRAVYRNPKELATCLKDIVDTYEDDLISYEKMEERIIKIVEANINDVYLRMKNAEKAKEEAKNMVVEAPTHIGAEFKPKENKKDRFSNLW